MYAIYAYIDPPNHPNIALSYLSSTLKAHSLLRSPSCQRSPRTRSLGSRWKPFLQLAGRVSSSRARPLIPRFLDHQRLLRRKRKRRKTTLKRVSWTLGGRIWLAATSLLVLLLETSKGDGDGVVLQFTIDRPFFSSWLVAISKELPHQFSAKSLAACSA